MKTKLIIVDACYLRTVCPQNLVKLAQDGATFVLLDTLFYELSTSNDDSNKSQHTLDEAMARLHPVYNNIVVWKHINKLCGEEAEKNSECYCMTTHTATDIVKKKLEENKPILNIDSIYNWKEKKDVLQDKREGAATLTLLKDTCDAFERLFDGLSITKEIKSKSRDEVGTICYNIVNNSCYLRNIIANLQGVFAQNMNDSWLSWHYLKACLAFICEDIRSGHDADYDIMSEKQQHRFANRKIDLDYLVALSRASILASNEKKDMLHFFRWMYGDSKKVITAQDDTL